MKNYEIINSVAGLSELTKNNEKMGVKATYGIIKNMKSINEAYENYVATVKKIAEEFGATIDEKGISMEGLNNENAEAMKKKLDELLQIEVEINPYKVKVEDFGSYEPTIQEMSALAFMIED